MMFEHTALRAQAMRSVEVMHAHVMGVQLCGMHVSWYVHRVNKHQKGMVALGSGIACAISRHSKCTFI